MSRTEHFRTQHKELLSIAGEISGMLTESGISKDPAPVRSKLSQLIGKLGVHLSMEDKTLYPSLLASPDPKVSDTAKRYIKEMGGLGEVLKSYKDKWATPSTIQQDPKAFIQETKGIFQALSKRIEKENNELYKLVDEMKTA